MIRSRKTSRITFWLLLVMLLLVNSAASAWLVQAQNDGDERTEVNPQEIDRSLVSRFDEQDKLRVIVQLKLPGQAKSADLMTPSIHQAQRDVLGEVKAGQVRVIHEYDYIPFMAMEVDRTAFEALQRNPNVLGIEEDILMKPMLTESVPQIGADDVWLEGVTGAGQVVAILDTGVDKNHPALAGKVVEEACYSTTSTSTSSLCPGEVSETTAVNSGLPCSITGCEHGTHVAGIVAANNEVIQGVAKDSKLIAIQVISLINGSSLGSWSTDQIKGLERVYDLRDLYNIASVNLSLGSTYPNIYTTECDYLTTNQAYKQIVDKLRDEGISTIAASGNDGYTNAMSSPACISSVISVGATTKSDAVAYYSNATYFLDLIAPGSLIYSTLPNDYYGYMSGTSMATPHVSGAWALLKSSYPSASVDYLLHIFKTTGFSVLDSGNNLEFPRIDVSSAFHLISLFTELTVNATDGDPKNEIIISWNDIENATYYQVFRNPINDPVTSTLLNPNPINNSFSDGTASPGTIYYYWVKACNETFCSDYSLPDDGWRGYTGSPPPPEVVSASDGEFTDKVQVSWYEVGGASSYQVYRNSENSFIDADNIGTPSTNLFPDLTAESGENYYYWVTACVGDDCSDPSTPDIGFRLENYTIYLPLTIK